jgi:hypothetical protein
MIMKTDWRGYLQYDPVKPLTDWGNKAIIYFTKRDLLREPVIMPNYLRELNYPVSILKRQTTAGYWEYPDKSQDNRLLQTFKNLQELIYKYEFDSSHEAIASACEYILSYQSAEGDIRGFIGNQYAPYYTGIVIALLIKAGYQDDKRIRKALEWLLSIRQDDGGWVMGSPGFLGISDLRWKDVVYLTSDKNAETMKAFDPEQPFSHSGTGMAIRAFALHPDYRNTPEVITAAGLIKSHFFKEDNYSSYKHADNWLRFAFPFWWNNLLAALDSISLIGIPANDPDVRTALEWFRVHQQTDGLWNVSYSKIHKTPDNSHTNELRLWITLAICRVLNRYYP